MAPEEAGCDRLSHPRGSNVSRNPTVSGAWSESPLRLEPPPPALAASPGVATDLIQPRQPRSSPAWPRFDHHRVAVPVASGAGGDERRSSPVRRTGARATRAPSGRKRSSSGSTSSSSDRPRPRWRCSSRRTPRPPCPLWKSWSVMRQKRSREINLTCWRSAELASPRAGTAEPPSLPKSSCRKRPSASIAGMPRPSTTRSGACRL